ncbi:MAG TPA: heme exporter protein CcmB [Chryseosolibacter sp.]|nr:heme exporter protein CcmB [Chryseosolibacter sp.]
MFRTVGKLISKEFQLELRRKSVISGLALYSLSLIFICYITFNLKTNSLSEATWSALFWLTLLFSIVNTVAKSFIGEKKGLNIYMYYVAGPKEIIAAKIIYNTFLSFTLAVVSFILFSIFIGNPVQDHLIFFSTLLLASLGLASALSLVSAIASKANNSNILMAVLSFPVVIGILLMAIRATKNALDGLDPSVSYDELLNLFAINCILTGLAYLLFPYIWRS